MSILHVNGCKSLIGYFMITSLTNICYYITDDIVLLLNTSH